MLNNFASKFSNLTNRPAFETFMFVIIILSAALIGVETYEIENNFVTILGLLDYLVTIIFLIEIIFRFLSYEKKSDFLKSGWNIFDSVIVLFSLVPVPGSNYVLLGRLLRVFRLLRLIHVLPQLKVLITSLIRSFPNIFYISILLFLIMYIYAAIGNILFKPINPDLWGNIGLSLLTLFNLMTFDGWSDTLYQAMEVFPYAWIYFISYAFLTVFTFLNLFIGAIISSIEEEINKERLEEDKKRDEELKKMKIKLNSIEKKLDTLLEKKN